MEFKIGDTHQLSQMGLNGWYFYKIHILAIIDGYQVVYKWYGRYKQWWHYQIKDSELLEQDIKFAKVEKAEGKIKP